MNFTARFILKSDERQHIWIPIDPAISRDEVKKIIDSNQMATLNITCELLNGTEQKFNKEINF